MPHKLSKRFYQGCDVVLIARELLGKTLVTNFDGQITCGRITETEAYCGETDKACHAFGGKRTKRTEVMFGPGGVSYVYLCYGIHHLFNIVTNTSNYADAVLIRAIEPVEGIATMLARRNAIKLNPKVSSGPGCVSTALGITTSHNGVCLAQDTIWIEEGEKPLSVVATTRIGVDFAGDDAKLPWRFYDGNSAFVSKR